ncbi:hypothetical protein HN51_017462 [Arachis hypogaea]|uniref:uncharacterized protein LOC107605553 isoform X1 n=1 Tax=Arachis ipaensis TaxID=130454 RepID=UPI0007AF9E8C|nr:uncharacterized protein LOC107605553 isoform X1 [Arachis ipaensis]XP_016162952.1 uncharacterized protein LOC107605553 isoform X1 [Arachis ipaensis]XP_025660133.1 uncharacterized protein LOC112755981 isoform X1 [Arachis hypogaea]XP_025660134.1 uncharacterized protein LOC112755981 isoform X1 [Arachis hypogaea]XP_025660135.1 uncharacterized protein LOC112755981 isoform X1 [Arachis hypogaea]QHN88683.1 uncharacterized protein DS421_16g565520 [Arachis hypogaea]
MEISSICMKQTEFNELANSTCSSSGSMNSKQKPIKEKSVKQLTFEAKEVNDNEEHDMGTSHLETKRMDARWYWSLFRKPKNGKVEVPQRVQPDIFRNETAQMPESRNPLLDEDLVRNDVGHDGEKSTHSKRNGIMLDTGSDLSTTLADDDDSNVIPSRLRDNIVGTGGSCSKRRRLDCDPVVSSNPSTTELQDGVDTDASVLQKEYPVNSPKEVTKHTCLICKSGGQLLGNCLLQDSWFRLCWLIIMVMLWLPNPRLLEKDQMRVQVIVPPQLKQAYLCRIVVI